MILSPHDPFTAVLASLIIIAAMASGALSTLQASRIEPLQAQRYENRLGDFDRVIVPSLCAAVAKPRRIARPLL